MSNVTHNVNYFANVTGSIIKPQPVDRILVYKGPGELAPYDGDFAGLLEYDPREIIWEGTSGTRLPLDEAVRLEYSYPCLLMRAIAILAPEWLAKYGWDDQTKEFAPNSIVPL